MGNTNNKINKYPHISIQFPFINDFIFHEYIRINSMNNLLIYKPKNKIILSKTKNFSLKIDINNISEFRYIDLNELTFYENIIKKGKTMMDSESIFIGTYTLKIRKDLDNKLESLILNYSV